MDFANYWFSATGSGSDLGQDVDQSLRFKGTQQLTRTIATDSAGTTSTFSFWVKLGLDDSSDQCIWSYGGSSYFRYNTSQSWTAYGGGAVDCNWTGKARDFSAWHHIVLQSHGNGNSTDNKIWLNGREISTEFNSRDFPGITQNGGTFRIGDDTNGNNHFTGYLAEFICVNGSAVAPTEFGRYNNDGVWVPKDYSGSYGSKGFHLTFDSSQDSDPLVGIGRDSSGNGNHFTASNDFDTADVEVYTGNEAGSTSTYESNSANRTQSLSNAGSTFDGDTAGGTQVSGGGGGYWYLENKSFSSLTGLKLLWGDPSQCADIRLNGTSVSFTTSGNYTVVDTADIPATVTEIAARRDRDNTQVLQVEVNTGSGFVALLDNTDNDVDYKDTPTNNYAVLNPLLKRSSSLNFEQGNLRVQFGSGGSHCGMVGFGMPGSSGKYYWEVTLKEQKEGGIGIVSEDFDLENGNNSFGMDSSGAGWEWILSEGRRDNNGETPNSHTIPNVGDTIGFLLDTTAGECTIEINGVAQTANNGAKFTNIPTDKRIYPYFRLGGASGDANLDWNFGQMPFLFQPTGYNPVETDSLPEPTIKDGSDHCQTLLGGGAGTFKFASEATDKTTEAIDFNELDQFTPTTTDVSARSFILDTLVPTSSTSFTIASGWGWSGITATIRVSSDGTANSWTTISSTQSMENSQTVTVSHSSNFRYIRIRHNSGTVNFGNITTTNQPLLGRAQSTFSTGLWWIKDTENSANHQFVDSVRGSSTAFTCPGDLTATYSAPTGSSVAWCWNYNSSDPTENGFSIVQHTGNSTGSNTQNVAHSLGGVPDFFINFRIGDTVNQRTCYAWHGSAPTANQRLQLDNTTVGSTLTSHWGQPTATNLVFGPGDLTNANGVNFITYVWRAVEGYSAFGKYTGNGDPDGTYVELGFRPALIILKSYDTAFDWQIYDTTRSPTNPALLTLNPNLPGTGASSGNDLDILSNGFKARDNGSINNNSGSNYLYMAWAENPFGGEDAPPVTAR